MNFVNMPELKWAFGYPMAIGMMTAINTYLWFRFRKAGWL
jgi:magnesium transporter